MGRGLISPPRSRFSPKALPSRPTKPVNPDKALLSHRKESQPSGLRATKITHTSSSSSSSSSNPPNKKKLESNNSTPKTAAKTSSKLSSSSINQQPTPSSKSNTKEAIGSGSRSDSKSNGVGHQQQHVKTGNDLNHSLSAEAQSEVRDLLHQLSIEGKEEECSSQSNAANNNGARIFEIYKEIASHRQGNSPITSYFTKLKALWDELANYIDMPQYSPRSIDIKLTEHLEREKVVQFLVGLHDSYSTICSQILLMTPFPTLEEAFVVIIREETRRELLSSLESIAAKVNNWVKPHNAHNSNNNGDNDIIEQIGDNLIEQQVDENESLDDELGLAEELGLVENY